MKKILVNIDSYYYRIIEDQAKKMGIPVETYINFAVITYLSNILTRKCAD